MSKRLDDTTRAARIDDCLIRVADGETLASIGQRYGRRKAAMSAYLIRHARERYGAALLARYLTELDDLDPHADRVRVRVQRIKLEVARALTHLAPAGSATLGPCPACQSTRVWLAPHAPARCLECGYEQDRTAYLLDPQTTQHPDEHTTSTRRRA